MYIYTRYINLHWLQSQGDSSNNWSFSSGTDNAEVHQKLGYTIYLYEWNRICQSLIRLNLQIPFSFSMSTQPCYRTQIFLLTERELDLYLEVTRVLQVSSFSGFSKGSTEWPCKGKNRKEWQKVEWGEREPVPLARVPWSSPAFVHSTERALSGTRERVQATLRSTSSPLASRFSKLFTV